MEVFLFRKAEQTTTSELPDIYCHICLTSEIQQFGTEYEPGISFKRNRTLNKIFSTIQGLGEFKLSLKYDMQLLNHDYDLYIADNKFGEIEVVEILSENTF